MPGTAVNGVRMIGGALSDFTFGREVIKKVAVVLAGWESFADMHFHFNRASRRPAEMGVFPTQRKPALFYWGIFHLNV